MKQIGELAGQFRERSDDSEEEEDDDVREERRTATRASEASREKERGGARGEQKGAAVPHQASYFRKRLFGSVLYRGKVCHSFVKCERTSLNTCSKKAELATNSMPFGR